MTTKSSEEIKRELEAKQTEYWEAVRRDNEEAARQELATKQAEEAARLAAEAETKARIAQHDQENRLAVERSKAWWANLMQNCYQPAPGKLGQVYGVCNSYLLRVNLSDEWYFSLCESCSRGKLNPYSHLTERYGTARIQATGEVVTPPRNFE